MCMHICICVSLSPNGGAPPLQSVAVRVYAIGKNEHALPVTHIYVYLYPLLFARRAGSQLD